MEDNEFEILGEVIKLKDEGVRFIKINYNLLFDDVYTVHYYKFDIDAGDEPEGQMFILHSSKIINYFKEFSKLMDYQKNNLDATIIINLDDLHVYIRGERFIYEIFLLGRLKIN